MAITDDQVVRRLLESDEPSIRWKARVNILGESRDSVEVADLEREIQSSVRVRSLLQSIAPADGVEVPVYAKWQGSQWVFMTLADIGYPRGDSSLRPAADRMVAAWLTERFFKEFEAGSKKEVYAKLRTGVPVMAGRYRTCASQQGNALHSVLALDLGDDRIHELAERLLFWQWPDGGWNCDKNAEADSSTFIHTLWSMRGLAAYADRTDNDEARAAVERATEVFLRRRLYRRASNGKLISASFTKLHYPLYWHYDILGALKVFAEIGVTDDRRVGDALDLLEEKRLPDGGWPAEERYYNRVTSEVALGNDYVDWGGVSKKRMNEWVTADALAVLAAFGRLG
jgi:hypothetical protein